MTKRKAPPSGRRQGRYVVPGQRLMDSPKISTEQAGCFCIIRQSGLVEFVATRQQIWEAAHG
jgi:hypothetical protein